MVKSGVCLQVSRDIRLKNYRVLRICVHKSYCVEANYAQCVKAIFCSQIENINFVEQQILNEKKKN